MRGKHHVVFESCTAGNLVTVAGKQAPDRRCNHRSRVTSMISVMVIAKGDEKMCKHYDAARIIEVGRAQDVLLDYKFLMWWVDNLGVVFANDTDLYDDFEE